MHCDIHLISERQRARELHAHTHAQLALRQAERTIQTARAKTPHAVKLRSAVGWAMVHAGLRLVQGGAERPRQAYP